MSYYTSSSLITHFNINNLNNFQNILTHIQIYLYFQNIIINNILYAIA
jgi:hypothetical protein